MSVIASMSFAADDFELGRLFEPVPAETVEIESIVPISTAVLPYFWVESEGAEEVYRVLDGSERVASVTVVEETDTATLLEIEWTDPPDDLVPLLLDAEAVVLRGGRSDDEWQFKLRFPDYDELSAFSKWCRERGLSLDLNRLNRSTASVGDAPHGLTPEQLEVLATAMAEGYFEVPRATTLTAVGDQLGITDSAASQRLRRGLATLLKNTILTQGDAETTESGLGT